jgi:D-3-phosphoglycerate dehydrogenase
MAVVLISAIYMIPLVNRFRPILEHYGLDLLVPEVHERMSEVEILRYAGQFDGCICGDDRFSERVLMACAPRLKVLSKWGTGIDSIDQQAAARLGVQVRRTPNAFTMPVADSVMGYILAFARRQPWLDKAMKQGQWEKITGHSLSECVLGVVGVGNCGKAVLRRARAFGMQLLGNDIIPIAPDFLLENNVQMVSLEQLLRQSDFISLNCDLNPTSYHLINRNNLAWMKTTAVLINTARGPIICEPDLIQALQQNRIGGAALDVFEVEPLPFESPLMQMDQVMLAPHNANSSPAAWERVHWNTIRNLLEGLNISHPDFNDIRVQLAKEGL